MWFDYKFISFLGRDKTYLNNIHNVFVNCDFTHNALQKQTLGEVKEEACESKRSIFGSMLNDKVAINTRILLFHTETQREEKKEKGPWWTNSLAHSLTHSINQSLERYVDYYLMCSD